MPNREFNCKCILPLWTGDYPGQAAVSGTHSKCCHWCTAKSSAAPEVNRRVWDGYRSHLPARHPMREPSGFYDSRDDNPVPPVRTHAQYVSDGLANQAHRDRLLDGGPEARRLGIFKKDYPYKKPLAVLTPV